MTGKKLSVGARIGITKRGFGLLHQYCPGLVRGKALSAGIGAVQPLWSVWFSARIINGLTEGAGVEVVFGRIAWLAVMNLAAALLRGVFDRISGEKESQMWCMFEKVFADKAMSMDYADLEDAGIRQRHKEERENLFMFGNGLGQLVWGTTTMVHALAGLAVSVSMTASLFSRNAGRGWIDSPLWIPAILAVICLGGLANSRATVKENALFKIWSRDTVWSNRSLMFYSRELPMSVERARDVRIYRQDETAERAFRELEDRNREKKGLSFRMALYPALAHVAMGLGSALCWIYVVVKAFLGAFGVGNIVQYIGALDRLGDGIGEMMFMLADNEVYCSHLQSLFEYLDMPNRKYEGTLPVEKRAFCEQGDRDYEIEFRDVSFCYPGADRFALRHVSLKIRVGKRLALVGMNGSGKTTFIRLLCRLYDPTEGEIRLNGIDIRKYDYDEYLSLFSVVFQDFRLFSLPLGENVAAASDYEEAKVKKCLEEAGFGERLDRMPRGSATCLYKEYDTKGVEVSGGEAQKIALARALYKDAPFIVLDEPTAALDPVAEAEIYTKFNSIVGDRTAVYISHRLSSCQFCDEIAVFDDGHVIQQGTHSGLLADRTGRYYELWNAQAQYYAGAEKSNISM